MVTLERLYPGFRDFEIVRQLFLFRICQHPVSFPFAKVVFPIQFAQQKNLPQAGILIIL